MHASTARNIGDGSVVQVQVRVQVPGPGTGSGTRMSTARKFGDRSVGRVRVRVPDTLLRSSKDLSASLEGFVLNLQ